MLVAGSIHNSDNSSVGVPTGKTTSNCSSLSVNLSLRMQEWKSGGHSKSNYFIATVLVDEKLKILKREGLFQEYLQLKGSDNK